MQEFSEKQRLLAEWWSLDRPTSGCEGVIAEGAIRSGKTWAMLTGFLLWSQGRFSGSSFIMAGASIETLKRNVVRPMGQILRLLGWSWKFNREAAESAPSEPHRDRDEHLLPVRREHREEPGRLAGTDRGGMLRRRGGAVPAELRRPDDRPMLGGRVEALVQLQPQLPDALLQTEYIDRADELNLLVLHFEMQDNPTLSPEIVSRYERMYRGVFYDRYIRGLWTLAEGLIYPDFKGALEGRYEGSAVKYAVSCDYGTQNAFAALLWAFDGKVWHVVDEYRYSGRDTGHQKTDADYVADMADFVGGLSKPPLFIIDPSATSFIAAMRQAGFKTKKGRNDVADGIRETGVCLGDGSVRISDACAGLIGELGGYCWDAKADGDKPVKVDDHSCDALRYGVATMRMYKPAKEQVNPFFGGR